jgi:hypothetical protein
LGPELEKYLQETGNYKEFLKLSEQLVQINEMICELRPVRQIEDQTELEALKKKLLETFRKRFRKRWTES